MILDIIFLTLVTLSCMMMFWAHFGKNPDGKELSFRLKMSIYWICLTLIGIVNILYYVIKDSHYIFHLVIGLVAFIEVGVEAIIVVCNLDKDLEKSEK